MEAIIFSASEFELGFGFGRVSEYYCSRDNRYGLGFPMVTGYQSYAGLQTRFRTFWHWFHVWFGYWYYISNPTVELDRQVSVFSVRDFFCELPFYIYEGQYHYNSNQLIFLNLTCIT